MKTTIKTIDVQAKEWFDKANGNSYFSMNVTVNFGMKTEQSFYVPMQYGYGDHYRDEAFNELQKRGFIPQQKNVRDWQYYKNNGITAHYSKQENCKKRDL